MWRKSIRSYISDLGYWGFIVIAPMTLDIIGVYQLATSNTFTGVPSWVWFQVAFIFLLVIPFIAYHRMRMRLQTIEESRVLELTRLILEVRDKAARVVMDREIKTQDQDILKDDYSSYSDALDKLHREAELDGGDVKNTIVDGFITFVSFHVTRFIAWDGNIISDPKTKKQLEIGELEFVGRMASRANETIQKIRNLKI
jgi:hypothetical protein